MSLKTSFFNITLFKANLKRFWWVSAAYVVLYLILVVLPMTDYNGFLRDGYIVINVLSALTCSVLPAIVFSYLNSSGSVTCMHAFPIKRRTHFTTSVISAYSLILIPMLIMYFISAIYILLSDTTEFLDVCEMFLSGVILMTVTMSGATLGSMITGNTISAIVFGGLFIGFPFYTELILKSFLELNVYGLWTETNLFMFEDFTVNEVNGFMLGYFAVNLALFIVSGLLYDKRRLETNGDIISFEFLKPAFIGSVAVFFGFLGYFYLYGIYRLNSIFYMIPFGIIGVTVSYMLSKNAFTLKGIWRPYAIYVLAVVALFVVVRYDLTGFERRVPKIDEIVSVDITKASLQEHRSAIYVEGKEYLLKNGNAEADYLFTEKEDIENIISLHRHLTTKRNRLNNGRGNRLPVIYKLKNGKTLKREYYLRYEEDNELLEDIYLTEQMKKNNWHLLNSVKKNIVSVGINSNRKKKGHGETELLEVYTIDNERAKAIIEAIYKDIENVSFEHIFAYNTGATRISINYICELYDKDGNPPPANIERAKLEQTTAFVISPEYTNTIALLKEYGLYDKMISVDDVAYARLRINGRNYETKITDRNEIKELYDFSEYYEWIDGNPMENGDKVVHYMEVVFYDNSDNVLSRFDFSGKNLQPLPMSVFTHMQKFLNTADDNWDVPTVTVEQIS